MNLKKFIFTALLIAVAVAVCVIFMPSDKDKNSTQNSYCSLVVQCSELVENPEKLPPEKRALVPADGIIYKNEKAVFSEGETVDELLTRELRNNKIQMEMKQIPGYNTAYVEGIANLYQADAGDLSGWLFFVNGKSSDTGSSNYILKTGDKVEWVYSCDFTETEHKAEENNGT